MTLVLPNAQDNPAYPAQEVIDHTDLYAIQAQVGGTGVIDGCAVTWVSGMTIAVAAGNAMALGQVIPVLANGALAVPASSSFDRRDAVVANSAGVVSVIEGTPCTVANWTSYPPAPPVKPAVSFATGYILLAEIYVPGNASTLAGVNIVDKSAPAPIMPPTSAVPIYAPRLVVFGHSYASSGGVNETDFAWQHRLAGALRSQVTNNSKGGAVLVWADVGGNTTGDGGYAAILQQVHPINTGKSYIPQPQMLILCYGNNDLGWDKSLERFKQAHRLALSRVAASQVFEELDPSVMYDRAHTWNYAIAAPAAPGTITHGGTAGSTTYTYEWVGVVNDYQPIPGQWDTVPSATTSTATGNATLSGTNTNIIPAPPAFPSYYTAMKLVRTAGGATQGVIATIYSAQAVTDTGLVATAYTPQTVAPLLGNGTQTLVNSGNNLMGPPGAGAVMTIYVPSDLEAGCVVAAPMIIPTFVDGLPFTWTVDGSAITPNGAAVGGVTLLGPSHQANTTISVTSYTPGTNTATLANVTGLSVGSVIAFTGGTTEVLQIVGISGNVVTTLGNIANSGHTAVVYNPAQSTKYTANVFRFVGLAAGPLAATSQLSSGVTAPTLTSALVSGTPYTTLAVTAIPSALRTGDRVAVGWPSPAGTQTSYQGTSQVWVLTAPAAVGATSLSVTSQNANANYAIGSKVTAISHVITATVGSVGTGQTPSMDGWWIEANAPSPVIVPSLIKPIDYSIWNAPLPTDTDVDTWNAAIQGWIGPGDEFPNAIYCNIDVLAKNPAYFYSDNVHPNDRGHLLMAKAIKRAMDLSSVLQDLTLDQMFASALEPRAPKDHAWARWQSGNLTLNSTSWAALPSLPQLSLRAQPFDTIEVAINAMYNNDAVQAYLDVVTWVNGKAMSAASGMPVIPVYSGNGIAAWQGVASQFDKIGSPVPFEVQPQDIVGGVVTLQWIYYTATAANKLIVGAAGNVPIIIVAKNLGQPNRYGANDGTVIASD